MCPEQVDILKDSALVLPGRRIGYGDVEIVDGRISKIIERPCRAVRLVMPGLVNCHGHTAMTLLRGAGSGLPLQRWLEEAIFPVEEKMTPRDIEAGVRWGVMEMLAGGTLTVADMYDFPAVCESVLAEAGMRGFVCRVGLSFVPGRLDECIEFTAARPDRHLSIHSEYLTDEAFCRALADANRELKRPVHFHVSETELEHRRCIEKYSKTPMAFLASTGLLDHGGYAAHAVYANDDDFRIMREHSVSLVHNPSSNLKLGSGVARVPRALELGVNVALGTDGTASNNNLNMFEEMHLASLIHKGVARDPTLVSAWDVIEMATVNGARALGITDSGELKEGMRADLAVIDLDRPHLKPSGDLADLIVHSMQASDVVMSIAGGKKLYDRDAPALSRFPSIDVVKAEEEFSAAVERLMR